MECTGVSDVEQHGYEDVVHQVQGDAVSEKGIPHHQQVLKRKLAAKQQTHPPAAGETAEAANSLQGDRKLFLQHSWAVAGDTDMP